MAVGALFGAIIKVLDDDDLTGGVAALQEYHHLVGLQELYHCITIGAPQTMSGEQWQERETSLLQSDLDKCYLDKY